LNANLYEPALRACDSRSAQEVPPDAATQPLDECCCQPPLLSLRVTLPLLSANVSLPPGLQRFQVLVSPVLAL
jgi:hypothetical protein